MSNKKKLAPLFSEMKVLQKQGASKETIQTIMQNLDKNESFKKIVKSDKGLNQSRNQIIVNLYGGSNETSGMQSIMKTINSPEMQDYLQEHTEITGTNAGGHTVKYTDLDIKGNTTKIDAYKETLTNIKEQDYAPFFDLLREIVNEGKFIPKVSDNLRGFVEGFIKKSGNKERREAFNEAWPTGDKAAPAQWDKISEIIQENYNQLSS